MRREVPVTVRVPAELKDRVDVLASEVGISSSAVWKILLHRSIKPLMDGESFRAVDLFRKEEDPAASEASGGARPSAGASFPGSARLDLIRRPRGSR
jgi:predicted transcriptional regulator